MADFDQTMNSDNWPAYVPPSTPAAAAGPGGSSEGYLNTNTPANPNNPSQPDSLGNALQTTYNKEMGFANTAPSGYLTTGVAVPKGMFGPVNLNGMDPSQVTGDWAKGYLLAKGLQSQQLKDEIGIQANDRANDENGRQNEMQAWKRSAVLKKQDIDNGMIAAAQDGGFSGVINYLQGADPDRALQFMSAKNDLDQSLMKTQTMQMLLPVQQLEAQTEAYGILGKMGQALYNSPAGDHQAMYDQMLPMIKAINPDAPANVADATPMFQLAIAQATPANQLFLAKNGIINAESDIGKIGNDIQRLRNAGVPDTDPRMVTLEAKLKQSQDAGTQAHLTLLKTQNNMLSGTDVPDVDKVQKATETMNTSLQNNPITKNYNDFMNSYTNVQSALQRLKANPNDSYAQQILAHQFALDNSRGKLGIQNVSDIMASYGVTDWQKKLQSWASGQQVVIDPAEQKAITDIYDTEANVKQNRQLSNENQYHTSANQYKGMINWNAIRLPSNQYVQIKANQYGNDASSAAGPSAAALSYLSANPQTLPQFIQKFGYDPTKPGSMQQQMMMQQQQGQR